MAKYPFSCWTYFNIDRVWDTFAQDYHDLGLTCPITPRFEDWNDPRKMLKLLDQFEALDMQVILWDARVTAPFPNAAPLNEAEYRAKFQKSLDQFGWHPAVWGFYVGDEPDAPDAATAFAVARIQKEMAPRLTPFLNLLPWFDWIGERIGSPAYAPYLDRAVKEGNLDVLGYDCYTQMWAGDSGYDVYFNNLREMRDAARRHNIPFWNTVLSSGHYDYACPNRDDMRWQISTSAALGAGAIVYFFVAEAEPRENYRCFPINAFNERTTEYGWLSDETRCFQAKFGEIIQKLAVQKCEFTVKPYGGLDAFAPDDTLLSADNAKGLNMLISTFTDAEGNIYRAVVNLDRTRNVEARLSFAPGIRVERWQFNHTWQILAGPMDAVGALSDDGRDLRMWMAPGQLEILKETKG